MHPSEETEWAFRDLGRIGYREAYRYQQLVHGDVLAGRRPPTLLLLEHEPVITMTAREGVHRHLLVTRQALEKEGIEVVETDRGGDITYHGPGQLVVYPIVPLQRFGLNVRQYVCSLEDAVMDALQTFGVSGRRDPTGIGVWVEHPSDGSVVTSKIAAMGVRVRRWVTLHGLALNITTNLSHFQWIVPCGLTRPVTSLQQLLGPNCPSMETVKQTMVRCLCDRLTRQAVRPEPARCSAHPDGAADKG